MKSVELSHRDLSDIYSRLALLLHSGITTSDGFEILASEETEKGRAHLFETVSEKLSEGEYLADTLRETGSFSSSDVGLISVAERSGNLEEILTSLGKYHEQRDRMGRTLRRTMIYPAVLLVVMLVVHEGHL
jgi:type II secretory pathway component PulF